MAEALKQKKPDEEKNVIEQAVGVVDKVTPDPAIITAAPGKAAERGGIFDIDPRPGATGEVGDIAGQDETYGGALTPEGTLGPSMKESREQQQRGLTIDEFKTAIERGQITSLPNVTQAKLLSFVKESKNLDESPETRQYFENQLLDFLDEYTYQQSKADSQVIVEFEREGKFAPTEEAYESPNLMSAQELKYAAKSEIRKSVAGKFANVPLNQDLLPEDFTLLEQIVVDRVSTNSMINVIEEKLYRNLGVEGLDFAGDALFSWVPSAAASGFGWVGGNIANVPQAVLNSAFGTQYETRYVELSEMWRAAKPYRDAVEKTWAQTLSDDFGLRTTQQTLQEIIREELTARLADDPERLDRLLNIEVQNADGSTAKIARPLVNESVASDVVSSVVRTLSTSERVGVSAIDTLLVLFGSGKARKASDKEYVESLRKKVDGYINAGDDFGERLGSMSFGEQLLALESDKKIKKFNRGRVERTLAFEAAEAGTQRIADDIVKLQNELDRRRVMDGKTVPSDRLGSYRKGQRYSFDNDLEVPKLLADIETMKRRANVARLRMHGSPILKSTLVEGLPLTAAQVASGYFMAPALGGDVFAAEGIGALIYLSVGRPTLKGIGYGFARANAATGNMAQEAGVVLETAASLVAYPFAKMAGAEKPTELFTGILTDRDLREYRKLIKQAKGRNLTFAELRALKYLKTVNNSLDDESRKMVRESMEAYEDLQMKIVGAFDPKEQEDVRKAFSETFAEMSDLGWMRSASALSMGSVSAMAVQGEQGIREASNLAVMQKDRLNAATLSVKKLRQMLADNKNIDPENGQVLEDYMKTLEATIVRFQDDFDLQMEDMDRTVVNLIETSLSDPSQDVKANTITALTSLGVDVKRIIDPELDVVAAQKALSDKAREALQERSRVLKETRLLRQADVSQRSRDAERVLMTFTADTREQARAPLRALDKKALADGVTVNVSGMITDLLAFTKDPTTGAPITPDSFRDFFSADSQFFKGQMGQKVFGVFNEMAKRSIRGTLSPETYDAFMNNEIIEMSRKAGLDVEKGQLLQATELDVALHLMEKGDFRGFQAAPGEVMEVYAAFRDYAVSLKDPKLSRAYKQYATNVRNLVKNNVGDYYNEWQAGADHYKVQWFDRFQRMEGPATKTLRSQKFGKLGPRPVDEAEPYEDVLDDLADVEDGVFARLLDYGYGNVEPGTMLLPLIGQIRSAMKGDATDLTKLDSQARRLFGEFADKDMQGNLYFDFSNPASKKRYDLLQSTLQEFIYDGWAREVTRKLDTAAKRSRRTPGLARDIRETGGLNMQDKLPSLENVEDVESAFNIRIINGPNNVNPGIDGAVVHSMLDLEGMVSESRSLQNLFEQDDDALAVGKRAANRIVTEIERQTKTVTGLADPKRNEVNRAIAEAAGVGRNSVSFVQRYFETGTADDLQTLALDVRLRLTGGDPNITTVTLRGREVPIEKAINDGIATLLLDGLMKKGGVVPMGGDKEVREAFVQPEALYKIMSGPAYEQVESILGPDHASFLRDVSQYFMMKSKAPMGQYDPKINNLVAEFGVNKLISRAFNLRRGMVSPQYVAAELSVALATQAGIDIMKLAASEKEGAKFMSQFLNYPENMTRAEIEMGADLIVNFVITEFASLGLDAKDYLGQIDQDLLAEATDDALEALKLKEKEGDS